MNLETTMNIGTQLRESYTYRPGQVPDKSDWSASESYSRAEAQSEKAHQVTDFFQAADQGPSDIDRREGFVRLQDVPAEGLLEEGTTTVTGFSTAEGDLQVSGQNGVWNGSQTTMAISNHGKEVVMDRPVYVN